MIRSFPAAVRQVIGLAIWELQQGETLAMPLSRPMPSIRMGAAELRVKDRTGAYRVFYFTRLADKVLVFHAFTKKSQQTPKTEFSTGRQRLEELLDEEAASHHHP